MTKTTKLTLIGIFAITLALSINNFASSNIPSNFKVAVVDVQKVVSSSSEVNALKQERKTKMEELVKFVENAKKNIEKEPDAAKKKALEEKYNKELNLKRDNIQKDYAKKLAAIDKNITNVIQTISKQGNYNIVLSKSVVIVGGTDITDDVSKAVK